MENNKFTHKDFLLPENNAQPKNTDEDETSFKNKMTKRTILTALISVALTFILTFAIILISVGPYIKAIGNTANNALAFDNSEEGIKSVDKLKNIIELIRSEYYVELDDEQILEAISAGLPAALDSPYTYYLTAEQNKEIEESMSGEYVGIGLTVTLTKLGETEVVEVYPGGPAEEGGLQTGDILLKVNGEDITTILDISSVAAKVKGPEGTNVKIEIFRKSEGKTFEVELPRRIISVQNVHYKKLDDKIGYVHINGFVNGVADDFIKAMDELQNQGVKDVIFDLRYNSGGGANIMLDMLDYLLPKDTLLATIKGREKGKEYTINWETKKGASVPNTMRYAILVNSYSASASEFFSGCLSDHGKAIIIGENTFGKGSGTSTYTLKDGSAVNITIFQYYLPGGECVEGVGIKPDIEALLPEESRYTSILSLTYDEDTVLQRAVAELQK